ncbi:MAG: diaminopimelate epimerase [Bacillota bacterium]|uniref:Diaminopimelate epimerase n=1 Tax=Thermanaerosceptrum fracticalcis TaxID=1712410 RepID=A0A7G6E1Y7_THEFR|nr:diaminopimelate epimerase [Thermanaerosceptrum fracticalcis]QNB46091.1 diaminopimelate epimerase [Thermanaerosceptrum fracticalcis]
MKFDYYKYHALGNDYIVIDPGECDIKMTPDNIRLICHRHFGIGSDGILYGPLVNPQKELVLKIYNPDGSEAEKSGNGIRIFSRYLFERKYVQGKNFSLRTLGGAVQVEILDEGASLIKVDMGRVTFSAEEIPVLGLEGEVVARELTLTSGEKMPVTCVSIGNPHCVVPMEGISWEIAHKYGPLLENHPQFPKRINVQFLKVLDPRNLAIEIWERGAGYTLASGSSSCAAASAAYRLGLCEKEVNVHMPGGTIKIEIAEDWNVRMTGPVTAVAKGCFGPDLLAALQI